MNTPDRAVARSEHELLVVDDNPASRYATARLLQRAGFRTREAATGLEGLGAADEKVSVMVLDVHLPDIDGFELCRRLRSDPKTARLPVLHLTAAYVTDEDKVRGLDSGADAYLTHPVEPAVLIATVRALVRTSVAEEALRRSEAKFRAIYAHAPGGICLLGASGEIVDANPAMLAFMGRALDEVVGRRVSAFVPEDWRQRTDAYTLGDGLGERRTFPVVKPSGEVASLEWMQAEPAEPGLGLALVTDISERLLLDEQRQQLLDREREARGAAEKMTRMKDDLIAVLSHELRTPLNAIMGWTHVLQLQAKDPQLQRGLASIERNGAIQARMVADLLDMSKLNTGKLRLLLDMVDPIELVQSAVQALQQSLEQNRQVLVMDCDEQCRPIRADADRVQQIVWNLLTNSIKFTPAQGEIRVVLRDEDSGVRISVVDAGRGISPEFLPHLFDRFSQSEGARNRRQTGLGLGLSIVKDLVEAHGGAVSACSPGVDQGSTFEVWLPRTGPAESDGSWRGASRAEARREGEPLLADMNVLVVDDDPDAREMLQIILADQGASVLVASDYASALNVLQAVWPDVLVSDIGMPGKNGYDLIREVRRLEGATQRRLAAIALTAFGNDEDRLAILEAGFDAHCPKPLRPRRLVQLILELGNRSGFASL